MHSFLLISKQRELAIDRAIAICKKNQIDTIDQTIIDSQKLVADNTVSKQTVGIAEIRNFQERLFLKPIRSKTKAVILTDAQLLTIPAQNAMLKMLEEPPENSIIILTADTVDALLPTVQSRCQIEFLEQQVPSLSEDKNAKMQTLILEMPEWGVGKRLKLAENLAKDKKTAIEWIEKAILAGRTVLVDAVNNKQNSRDTARMIKILIQFHKDIATSNVNLRLALENLFLTL